VSNIAVGADRALPEIRQCIAGFAPMSRFASHFTWHAFRLSPHHRFT
jgi:hypothetical protein